ncbi:MAG: glutaminyl-peptide cyclotransferase [Planctomycetales bacterium]|nr:glutaminyl-peptide cyclotransferase [Planctomycetales bacterium]
MRKTMITCGVIVAICVTAGVMTFASGDTQQVYGYKIVAEYPHDTGAYCQGLAFDDDGKLFEGTGQYGESVLREVQLETGKAVRQIRLNQRVFGEGVTVVGDKIYQLTWKRKAGYVYDKATLKVVGNFRYSGEGWGITFDGKHLIMSDGSSTLRFLNPETFKVERKLSVRSGRQLVADLNELEFINGEIWANVWFKDYIARISPKTGEVVSWVNLAGLFPQRLRSERDAVLNGIAYDKKSQRLFVTGKRWPKMFEIELVEQKR